MRKKKRILLLLTPLVLLALAGAAYYLLFQAPVRQARALYQEGRTAYRNNEFAAALEKYEAAFSRSSKVKQAGFALFDEWVAYDSEAAGAILERLEKASDDAEAILGRQIRLALYRGDRETAARLREDLQAETPLGFEGDFAELLFLFSGEEASAAVGKLTDLRARYPEKRPLTLVYAQVLSGSENMVNRVQAKAALVGLLDQVDGVSCQAALHVLSSSQIPLAEADAREAGRHLAAHPFAEMALASSPAPALRVAARRLAPHDAESAARITGQLIGRADAEPIDWVLHMETARLLGRTHEVEAGKDHLSRMADLGPEDKLLLARQFFVDSAFSEGWEFMEEVLEAEPDNATAYRILASLAADGLENLSAAQQIQVLEQLSLHPEGTPQARLSAIGRIIELDPLDRPAHLDLAVSLFSETETSALANWLISIGEAERTLAVLPENRALSSLEALTARFNALLALGRWESARALLDKAASVASPLQREVLMVRLLEKAGDPEAARVHLEQAVFLAGRLGGESYLLPIATQAGQLGAPEIQRQAYDLAFQKGLGFSREQAIGYISVLMQEENLDNALEFARYCRDLFPDDAGMIHNFCYVSALRDQDTGEIVQEMQELVERYPAVPEFRATLALALLQNNQARLALDGLQSEEAAFELGSVQSKMIYALVMAANGDTGVAMNVANSLDFSRMLPAERDLLLQSGLVSRDR